MPVLRIRARSAEHNPTWYSHNMTMDAVVFIMSFMEIKSKEIDISRAIAEDRKKGHIWTKDERNDKVDSMIAEACSEWKDKVPNLISLVNPANGPKFLPLCKEIHKRLKLVEKRKKNEGPMIGLDCARVFVGAVLTADCRCTLLEAHYGSEELKKKYHHPKTNLDGAIRLWLQQWSMWCYIDHQGSLLVSKLASRVFRGKLYGDFSGIE